MINSTDLEKKYGKIINSMKGNIMKDKNMEKEV